MALGENNGGITAYLHGAQLFGLIGGLGIIQVIQLFKRLGDFFFKVKHAFLIYDAVKGCVAGRTLFHKFREGTGLICGFPGGGYVLEDPVAHGSALPVGNYSIAISFYGFIGNMIGGHLP